MTSIGHNSPPTFSSETGWVKIARSIRSHPLVGIHLFARPADPSRGAVQHMAAFIDLLMECRYEDGFVQNGGRKMEVKRGSMVGAVSWLAHRWNWTPMAVRIWLDKLEADMMISRIVPGASKDNKHVGRTATILSLCNYDQYQSHAANDKQTKQQTNSNQAANEQQQYKDNKGTREQDSIPSDLQSEGDRDNNSSRAKSARAGSGKGTRNFIRSSWLPADKPDGSQGLLFENGRLSVVNGCRFSIQQDFPDIDIDGACNKAAAEIVATQRKERCELSHMDCLAILRKHCQWEVDYRKKTASQSFSKTPGKRDFLSGLTPEQRALVDAQRSAKQGAH